MISKVNFFSMSWIVFQLFSLQAQSYCASCPKPQAHDELKAYHGFTLSFNSKTKLATWVYYELVPNYVNGPKVKRASKFLFDSGFKEGTARNSDYKKSGFDKGHLAPAADMAWSAESMHDCFYFSNITPQRPECNRGIWKQLEEIVRKIAKKADTVKVFTGPVFNGTKQYLGSSAIEIPISFYKIIQVCYLNKITYYSLMIPNTNHYNSLNSYACTIDYIEAKTGLDFFKNLESKSENLIESRVNLLSLEYEN